MPGFEHHTSLPQPEKLPSIAMLPSLDPTSSHTTLNNGSNSTLSSSGNSSISSNTNGSFYTHHYQPTAAILSTSTSSSCFLQPAPMVTAGVGMLSHPLDNQTPPLTPTVTPSSYLMDLMEMKRKCSVDVGPFGFSSMAQNQQNQQQSVDEPYRRASDSHAVDNQNGVYRPPTTVDYPHHHHQMYDNAGYAPVSYLHVSPTCPESTNMAVNASGSNSNSSRSRRGSKRAPPLQQSNKDHKHVCKYAFCGWSFKRYEHLKRHMLVHSGERPFMCQFPGCGKSFSRSDNFRAHCRTHTKKGYSVTKQQQQQQHRQDVSSYNSNIQHQATIQEQQQQQQHVDQPMFPVVSYMNQHDPYMRRESPSATLGYAHYCHSHHYSFQQQHQTHYPGISSPVVSMTTAANSSATPNSVSAAAMLPPPQPSTTSTMEHRGSSPVDSPLSIEDDKAHVCPIPECKRPFKRLEHLKRHMRTHTMERPFACTHPKCNKTFSRSDNLSQHIKTHQRNCDIRRGSSGSGSSDGLDVPMSDVDDDEALWS